MLIFLLSLPLLISFFAEAQSYIDSQRERIEDGESLPRGSYIENRKKVIAEEEAEKGIVRSDESYTEQRKRQLGVGQKKSSHIDQQRERIQREDVQKGEEESEDPYRPQTDSAIQAVRDGRSELELKRPGKIRHGLGLRVGAVLDRDIRSSGGGTGRTFSEVYGDGFNADISLFYEFKPFYSEQWGSLGLIASPGFAYYTGKGKFAYNLLNEKTGENFGETSRTQFHFTLLNLMTGANYRFNLSHYIRPFVQVGHTVVGYLETRSDDQDGNRGWSNGFHFSGGVSILLDWISRKASFELYETYSVKHYYLTIEYSRLQPISGNVAFEISGVYAGFLFEL